jgi:ribulose-5-phosphate 4-epimerase/fuculose-1-phosphate aldolase
MHDLLKLAHSLSLFVVGAEGNVSQRNKNGFWVKASGFRMSDLNDLGLIQCDFSGEPLKESSCKPSIESSFHAYLLSFPDIEFVAHTHPTNTLKILCSGHAEDFAAKRYFPDQVVYNGVSSCYVPYAHPGPKLLEAIKESLEKHLKKNPFPKVFLLQNHGIIVAAKTAKQCLIVTEICEKSAEVFLGALGTSIMSQLTSEEITEIENDANEKYRAAL